MQLRNQPAWMLLTAAVGMATCGCDVSKIGKGWFRSPGSGVPYTVVSEPVPLQPPQETSPDSTNQLPDTHPSQDPAVNELTQNVESYAARLEQNEPSSTFSAHTPASRPASEVSGKTPPQAAVRPPASDANNASPGLASINPNQATSEIQPPSVATEHLPDKPSAHPIGVDPEKMRHSTASSPLPPASGTVNAAARHATPQVELIDVRAVASSDHADLNPLTALPNQPIGSGQHPAGTGATPLIEQLEASVREHPEQLDEQIKLRLLYLATGQVDKAEEPVAITNPIQTELLNVLIKTLVRSRESLLNPSRPASSALLAVDELHRLIAQQSGVIIPKIALVTRVNSFGDYEAIMPPRFPAGRPINVFIYTEVANFRSEPSGTDKLRTVLSEKVEVFDSSGKIIWQRSEPNIEDHVASPRRDFFIPFPLTLPASTPPGEYILKVTIEDKLGATTDQQRITLTIQ